ncbi:hypothetical protein C7S13_7952 [Burkholderia cepacia]|nr:hypothetical protein [Burkholderia cepacia]
MHDTLGDAFAIEALEFSMRCESCRSTGPFGPAVCEFWLSPTGEPLSRVSSAACEEEANATQAAAIMLCKKRFAVFDISMRFLG